jgi:hypothetical protein
MLHSFLYGHGKMAFGDSMYMLYSSWKEMLVFFAAILCTVLFIRKGSLSLSFLSKLLLIMAVSIYGLSIAISKNVPLPAAVTGTRDFMLPFFLYLGIIATAMRLTERDYNLLNRYILFMLCSIGVYGLYTLLTFRGDLNQIWAYNLYKDLEKGVAFATCNYIRDDKLRVISVFSSPLEYSFTILFGLFLTSYLFLTKKKMVSKTVYALIFIALLYFAYISNVRSWLLGYLCGILSVFFLNIPKRQVLKTSLFYAVPLILIAGTFLYMLADISSFGKDLSAIGRLGQYAFAPVTIGKSPLGYGFGMVGPKFDLATDSTVLTILFNFGVFVAPVYLFMIVGPFNRLISHSRMTNSFTEGKRALLQSILAFFSALIYISAFQYLIQYAVFYLMFVLAALLANELRYENTAPHVLRT